MNKYIFIILFIRFFLTLLQYFTFDFGFNIIVIGKDELLWQENSYFIYENIFESNFFVKVLSLHSSYNNLGWPLLVAISYIFFGVNYFNIILIKFLFLIIATFSLKKILSHINYSRGLILFNIIFLNFYYPLAIFHNSFLRDDFLFFLIIIAIDLLLRFHNRKFTIILFFKFLFIFWMLVFTRFLAIFLVFGFFLNLKIVSKKLLYLVILCSLIVVSLTNFSSYILNFFQSFIFDTSFFFKFFKFYFGPFPINMFFHHSEYSPYWYIFSFIFVVFFSLSKLFWLHVFKNKYFLIFTICFIFYPYYIRSFETDSIGPRQFAMIAPFIFFLIYSKLLYPIILKLFKYINSK